MKKESRKEIGNNMTDKRKRLTDEWVKNQKEKRRKKMKLKIKDLKTENGYVKNVNVYYRDELVGSICKESDCEIRVIAGPSEFTTCCNYSLEVFINLVIDFCDCRELFGYKSKRS